MPPRKGKKHAAKSKPKKRAAKPKLAAARALDDPTLSISSTGTVDPPGYVRINPGGVVKFKVTFPTGANICYIPFGQIMFGTEAQPVMGAVGTIKVGSGN